VEREANDGHDGTWVAHPGLVTTALTAFDAVMKTPNQIDRKREDVQITAADILRFGPQERLRSFLIESQQAISSLSFLPCRVTKASVSDLPPGEPRTENVR
jgi:malate synthase